jgi:hypothetical protein
LRRVYSQTFLVEIIFGTKFSKSLQISTLKNKLHKKLTSGVLALSLSLPSLVLPLLAFSTYLVIDQIEKRNQSKSLNLLSSPSLNQNFVLAGKHGGEGPQEGIPIKRLALHHGVF